jgi:hypothetical protein
MDCREYNPMQRSNGGEKQCSSQTSLPQPRRFSSKDADSDESIVPITTKIEASVIEAVPD